MTSVRTKYLDVDVSRSSPDNGPPVLLLHGGPDDATTWALISGPLNDPGFHTIAPMHRGFGRTRFLAKSTRRTGNVGILALDAIDLMDALGIEKFFVAGHDWRSNIAETLAAGWPKRVPKIAMLSTPSRLAD
jgi:pimeloyl-ACP methyl ester carboxylesterase